MTTNTDADYPATFADDYGHVAYLEVQIEGADSVEQAEDFAMMLRDAICFPGSADQRLDALPFKFHMHAPTGC